MAKRKHRVIPDRDGWWMYHEDGMEPVELLVLGGEVAEDEELSAALGREIDEEIENYWECTSCRYMAEFGKWKAFRPCDATPAPAGRAPGRETTVKPETLLIRVGDRLTELTVTDVPNSTRRVMAFRVLSGPGLSLEETAAIMAEVAKSMVVTRVTCVTCDPPPE